jgi:outer membrane lipoprotein
MGKKRSWQIKRCFPSRLALGMAYLCLAFIFSGCATPTKQQGKQADYETIAFSTIHESPEAYKGRVVRLGGVIIATENREDDTVLEILEKPLNWQGRPKAGDTSGGRFMVVFEGFLDEAVYRPDRPVTIVGEVMGTKSAPIGETTYDYPLLSGKEARLWKERGEGEWPRLRIGVGIGGGSGGTRGGVGVGTSF